MPYNNILPSCLCIFILAICICQTPVYASESVDKFIFRLRFKVHILNGFANNANPLILQCHSHDDDLGQHTLWKDQEFQFKFGLHIWRTTHFICNFKWGSKSLDDVTVFTNYVETRTCRDTGNCFWKAAEDGIYFSNNIDKDWKRKIAW